MPEITRIAIIQPAVPEYRIPFFRRLIALALADGIQIDIFAGETPPETRGRADTAPAPFVRSLPTRVLRIGKRHLLLKSPVPVLRGKYDLIILEHAVRNLESYILLARLGPQKVAFWGHGKTYTKKVSGIQEGLKYWLSRRAAWFFGYTQAGVDAIVEHGYPRSRTTVLNNSIDVAGLRTSIESVNPEYAKEFAATHDLQGRTAIFIGGLDAPKRLEFLIDAADEVHRRLPDFRIMIAGSGDQRALIEDAASSRPWMIELGVVFGDDKALALSCSEVIAMPGRVGLVAVDSFAAAKPIITTAWPWHAPEFEYLEDGINAIITEDDVHAYADELSLLLMDQSRLDALQEGARDSSRRYSVEGMAENFLQGLISWRDTK